jgi:hypothetical protein
MTGYRFDLKVLISQGGQRLYKGCHGCAEGSSVQARV